MKAEHQIFRLEIEFNSKSGTNKVFNVLNLEKTYNLVAAILLLVGIFHRPIVVQVSN